MNIVIEAIIKMQKRRKLSDTKLAREFGVDQTLISLIKRGKERIGAKLIHAIAKNPELRPALYKYLESPEDEPAARHN